MKILIHLFLILVFSISLHAQTTNNDSIAKRYNEMMAIMMTQPKVPIKTIGILGRL